MRADSISLWMCRLKSTYRGTYRDDSVEAYKLPVELKRLDLEDFDKPINANANTNSIRLIYVLHVYLNEYNIITPLVVF